MIEKAAQPKVGLGGIRVVTVSPGPVEKRGRQAKDVRQLRGVQHVKAVLEAIVVVRIGLASVRDRGRAGSP